MEMRAEPDEIVQAEDTYDTARPVAVSVCGPTQVRELPAQRPGYRTEVAVGASVGVRLLAMEPRRKRAVIIAMDQDIWVAASQAGAQAGASGAARIPKGVALEVRHLDEVWACAMTSTSDISIFAEYWSE